MKPIIVQGNHRYNPGHLTGTIRKVVTAVTPKAAAAPPALPPAQIFEIPDPELPVLADIATRFPDGQASRRERRAREREQKKNNR